MEFITGAGIGLFLFVCTVAAFSIGIKFGMEMSKGKQPEFNPVKSGVELFSHARAEREARAHTARFEEGMSNLFSYNGETHGEVKDGGKG